MSIAFAFLAACVLQYPADLNDSGTVLDVDVVENVQSVLVKHATFVLEEPASLEVSCEAGYGEEHHWTIPEAGREPTLSMTGLLAETTYACTVAAPSTDLELSFEVTTAKLPSDMAIPVLLGDPQAAVGDYTLFNTGSFCRQDIPARAVIADREGRIRWYRSFGEQNMDLQTVAGGDGTLWVSNQTMDHPMQVSIDDLDVLWEGPAGMGYHHELQLLPSGQLLTILTSTNERDGKTWEGFTLAILDPETNGFTWTWDSQQGVDTGMLPDGTKDAYHANAAVYVEDALGEGIYVSLHHLGQIIRVDVATKQISWKLGEGGDFVLIHGGEWFNGQHAPEVDGNQILVYDNGSNKADPFTRVVEYDLDVDTMTATQTWEYVNPEEFYPILGDADRVGEHILVANGFSDCSAIGQTDATTTLDEIDLANGALLWQLRFPQEQAIYRAQSLQGCDIFPAGPYCQ